MISFAKTQAQGNDFIIINELEKEVVPEENKSSVTKKLCDRRFSIGADGIVFIKPSTRANISMRVFNSDGSEAEACGNGIRCFSKYVHEKGVIKKDRFSVETLAGIVYPELLLKNGVVASVRVHMGRLRYERREIPMLGSSTKDFVDQELEVGDSRVRMSVISIGNPHAVIFTDDSSSIDTGLLGPRIEHHKVFPNRINVHWVQVTGDNELKIISWERGAGKTLACGTGAVSCAAIAVLLKKASAEKPILARVPGGELKVEIVNKNGKPFEAYLEGSAETVYEGTIP